jgi:hypothetical protein
MDKVRILSHLANITANLSPEEKESSALKKLRYELTGWLLQHPEISHVDTSEENLRVPEEPYNDKLKTHLDEIVEERLAGAGIRPTNLRVVKRDFSGVTDLGDASVAEWSRGQKAEYSLGPFKDHHGKLLWFDFFNPLPLTSVTFKGETMPFLKFSAGNYLFTHPRQDISLNSGSLWIQAIYLTPTAPPNSFVGLKIKSGSITLSELPIHQAGAVQVNPTATCKLNVTLDNSMPAEANLTDTGKDALETKVHLPDELVLNFSIRKSTVEKTGDADFRLYGSPFHVHFETGSWVYDQRLQRIGIPLHYDSNILSIKHVYSTIFKPSEEAKIDTIHWSFSVTIDDHTKLGEAVGNGGFLLQTTDGLEASWINLQGGPVKINKTFLLVEPRKIELHAFQVNALLTQQRFYLWYEEVGEKRSSITIDFLKNSYLKYVCLSQEEIELLTTQVNVKGNLDRPLTTDGKKVKASYTNVQYLLGKHKDAVFLQCLTANQINASSIYTPQTIKPISFALSNAFAKVSPRHEFILIGQIVGDDSIDKGVCSLYFGLYSFVPILPDPYVTNIDRREGRERIFQGESLAGYLQAWIRWEDRIATMTFHLPSGQPLFSKIESKRSDIHASLFARNSSRPIGYTLEKLNKQGTLVQYEYKVSDVLKEDEENDRALKNNFQNSSDRSFYPDLFLLDVSGYADQFGVGFSNRSMEAGSHRDFFSFEGIELVSPTNHVHIVTLPPIQWEAVRTIQNPKVLPKPFPSPAYSLDTGDPAVIYAYSSYHLVPVTPLAAVHNLVKSFRDLPLEDQRANALINLPFGMKAFFKLEQVVDQGVVYKKVTINNNQPHFKKLALQGGNQLNIEVHLPHNDPTQESPGFSGATIQTRNLIENNNALGLSVLGLTVDEIFNNEFKPGSNFARVPLRRIDLSGYGVSTFSNWANPKAQFAATSKTKFDVIVGRTSHEIVQVRTKLYACGASVVRTITIQRTAGGGITRHDSGWEPEGPGLFDFSYEANGAMKNDFTFHLGPVKGFYNITNIRDTPRIIEIPPLAPLDELARLQEVIYDADIHIEDVNKGQKNGFVSSKGQKGFVQLAPTGKPISPAQLKHLLSLEGPIGGPLDCQLNVGQAGQEMRVVRIDTNSQFGSLEFVNAARGSLVLPNDGTWSIIQSKNNNVIQVENHAGLPLVQYNSTPSKYEFREPAEDPNNKYGLMHGSSTHRTLFPNPFIIKNDPVIVTEQPHFADLYALVNSNNTFPAKVDTFPVGAGDGKLKIHGSGILELISPGELNILAKPRMLHNDAKFSTYIEYFDKNNRALNNISNC